MNITSQTCMKGSPARARVVYAPVLEVGGEGRLVRACSILWNILWRISNMYIFVSVWAVCVFLYHFSIHFIAIDRIKASCAMLFLYWHILRSDNWCLCQVRLSSWKGRKTRIEGKYNCISRSSSLLLSLAFTLLPIYSVIYNFSLQAANQLYNFLDLRKYTEVAESIFLQTFRTTFLSLCDIILVILLSFTPKILHLDQFNLSLYSWELVRLWWDKHFSCATKFC
jgi:hypothetical protein